MAFLPFKNDQKMTDVLKKQSFTLSAEVIPPRNGTEQSIVLDQIHTLIQAGAQFLAVTKGAGGSLRGGSLPIVQTIKERFSVPCIAHFTCRDLTPQEVENHLMDHHYFGVRNILALRGDPPNGQSEWKPREGGYHFAYQLIEQIRDLNQGTYLNRANGPVVVQIERTDFCIGAAAYPDHPQPEERIRFFELKVKAGAEYGITDMLFDSESYARFLDLCEKNKIDVPLLPGTRILKSQAQAQRMKEKFKIHIPKDLMEALPQTDSPDSTAYGLELFMKFVERLKKLGAPGIHLYVITDTRSAATALRHLSTELK